MSYRDDRRNKETENDDFFIEFYDNDYDDID